MQIKDVRDHRKEDRMESFFLAETTKYLYLLFDTDNFIHNQGQHGTVINTPNGECIIYAGGYIFNTEAHPIDPSALHCCYNVPKQKLFDFSHFHSMKKTLRGDNLQERNSNHKKNKAVQEEILESTNKSQPSENEALTEDIEDKNNNNSVDILNQITTESTMKLDDNDSLNLKMNDVKDMNENLNLSTEIIEKENEIAPREEVKFVPQAMLEKIRSKKNSRNKTWEDNFKILSCQAQPFIQKLSIFGEFFNR